MFITNGFNYCNVLLQKIDFSQCNIFVIRGDIYEI